MRSNFNARTLSTIIFARIAALTTFKLIGPGNLRLEKIMINFNTKIYETYLMYFYSRTIITVNSIYKWSSLQVRDSFVVLRQVLA